MAKGNAPKPQRIAVDTNFILNCYAGDETALAAWEIFEERVPKPLWIIPPTASQELINLADIAESRAESEFIQAAALDGLEKRHFEPVPLIAVDHGIAEIVASKLRSTAGRLAFIMWTVAVLKDGVAARF